MADLYRTWLATFTRRWHVNPDLCHTVDQVGRHSNAVTVIILHCWPDASRDLIIAAALHDLAESITGDIPPAAKEMFPTFSMMEKHVAIANGWHVDLNDQDEARLKFADKLDAFLYARKHNAANSNEWDKSYEWLRYAAERLGVMDMLEGVL